MVVWAHKWKDYIFRGAIAITIAVIDYRPTYGKMLVCFNLGVNVKRLYVMAVLSLKREWDNKRK